MTFDVNAYKDEVWRWVAAYTMQPRVYWVLRPEDEPLPCVVIDQPDFEFTMLSGGWQVSVELTVRCYGKVGTSAETELPTAMESLRASTLPGAAVQQRIENCVITVDSVLDAPTSSPDVFGIVLQARQLITRGADV